MQHIAEHCTHFSARKVVSNFEPCALLVLAKLSTHLASLGDYVRSNGRLVFLTVSQRVILYELASEITEAMVSCVVIASFASTANDRVLGWSKVDVKLQSRSFGARD
jgi:hypothetical protein